MDFSYENQKLKEKYSHVLGCDEVGRGCLAGPVVAAVVWMDDLKIKNLKLKIGEIKDSKLLSAKKRVELAELIKEVALWSIAEVSPEEVDSINIHQASLLAMKKAVEDLLVRHPEFISGSIHIAVDGKFKIPGLNIDQNPIIGGDNKVLSISAASIIAKVYRDDLMQKFDKQFPLYEFGRHKGYATEVHRKMVLKHGLTSIHRLSFCGNLS